MPIMKENSEFCLRRIGSPASFPGIGDVFSLNPGVNVIGRNPSKSDIFLDSMKHKALISRLHARINNSKENGKPYITICDTSLNGTYINDRKINDTVEVMLGDVLTFGHVKGAVLTPGSVAKQPNSEFRFKIEKYSTNTLSNDDKENTRMAKSAESGVSQIQMNGSPLRQPFLDALIPDLSPHLRRSSQLSDKPPDLSPHLRRSSQLSDKPNSQYSTSSVPLGSTAEFSTSNVSSLQQSSQSSDYNDDELFAYAAAAGGAMDEESDEELFSVDLPNTSNGSAGIATSYNDLAGVSTFYNGSAGVSTSCNHLAGVSTSHNGSAGVTTTYGIAAGVTTSYNTYINTTAIQRHVTGRDSPYIRPSSAVDVESNSLSDDEEEVKETEKVPAKPTRKRRKTFPGYIKIKKANHSTWKKEKVAEKCAHKHCVQPQNELVNWVQCDYCHKWYHLLCMGMDIADINSEEDFNCGCKSA